MDTDQLPPPYLPDLISSPSNMPNDQTMTGCFQKQQVSQLKGNNCQEGNITSNMLLTDESVVQMMMGCSMDATSTNSSGIQSSSITSWPSANPSSSSSTTFNEYPPQQCLLPPPPSPPIKARHISQPPHLPDFMPGEVVEEFEGIMYNDDDKAVLGNSVVLLFTFSNHSIRGLEVCHFMAASPVIMKGIYYVLTNEKFKDDDLILCYATGNLANISKYEEGRAAILSYDGSLMSRHYYSPGVESLIRSLSCRESNVVIFAITAIHNLLLDRRAEFQEIAKEQIKHGLKFIVELLANQSLILNYEFKVIVLDCLQILAYGNRENRLAIKESGGPLILLRTIKENFENQPTEELILTASRVLKSLSACPENKIDIIKNGGINILTYCIKMDNQKILKTCLWTLRNLSDVINNSGPDHSRCIEQLVQRLLHILHEYHDKPCIITCALGILANLTCNNENIKQLICEYSGIDLLLKTVDKSFSDSRDFRIVDREILEPAICALCHLMNQNDNPNLANDARKRVLQKYNMFMSLKRGFISEDLSKAIEKLSTIIQSTMH